MTQWRWFDHNQTGRADFVRLHRRAIRTGLLGAASVFFALRALLAPDGAPADSGVALSLLLLAPLFVYASFRPSTLVPAVLLAMGALLLLLVDTLFMPGALIRVLLRPSALAAFLPVLAAYGVHLLYMRCHALLVTRPRDFGAYSEGYLGLNPPPAAAPAAGRGASWVAEDDDPLWNPTDPLWRSRHGHYDAYDEPWLHWRGGFDYGFEGHVSRSACDFATHGYDA